MIIVGGPVVEFYLEKLTHSRKCVIKVLIEG
jgi:hypothetical protein